MKYLKKFTQHSDYTTYMASMKYSRPNVSYCLKEDEVHYMGYPVSTDYFTLEAIDNCTFSLSGAYLSDVSYSLDSGETWVTLSPTSSKITFPTVTSGNEIQMKGSLTPYTYGPYGIGRFSSTGRFNAKGKPTSLLFEDNIDNNSLGTSTYTFNGLFSGCTNLISAENLNLSYDALTSWCFAYMFKGCTNLIKVPSLPTTTLANDCYYGMFMDCTSLTTVPSLPATTLANGCYRYMFDGCTSLTTLPTNYLSASTITAQCYAGMFYNCSNLTTTLTLPATTMESSCYYTMFENCTSLTVPPELPATTLADSCYERMFYGCTALTITPDLPASTLADRCYFFMLCDTNLLPDCRNINFSSEAVAQSGGLAGLFAYTKVTDNDLNSILPKNNNNRICLPAIRINKSGSAFNETSGYRNMFAGCTGITIAPELPALYLVSDCYIQMFYRCTNLVTPPSTLPATSLYSGCYEEMFKDCTSLLTPPAALPATSFASQQQACYRNMFAGCTSLTTTPELPAMSPGYYSYDFAGGMFSGCTSLTQINTRFTAVPDSAHFRNWVSGVSATGTFIHNSDATWSGCGTSTYPCGWTLQKAS